MIGHVVNMCARLEEIAAPGQILLGSETSKLLGEAFELSGTITLKLAGVLQPVPVTELVCEKLVG